MSKTNILTSKHIPAWKKLGLKLKNETAEPKGSGEEFSDQLTFRTKHKHHSESVHPAELDQLNDLTRKDTLSTAPNQKRTSPAPSKTTRTPKRKSVSFTPETKSKDGEGIKQIYKTWVDAQEASDPSFNPLTLAPALRSLTPKTLISSSETKVPESAVTFAQLPKKAKKKKKKQGKIAAQNETQVSSQPSEEPPYLTYLKTFHTDPDNWKFSTQIQTRLLKNIFNLYRIPTDCDPALLNYLRGLKGSSARSRARSQALAIREKDGKWLDCNEDMDGIRGETNEQNKARKTRDYEAAVNEMKAMLRSKEAEREEKIWTFGGELEKWEMKLKQRKRAEVILWALGEEEEHTPMVKPEEAAHAPARELAAPRKTMSKDAGAGHFGGSSRFLGANNGNGGAESKSGTVPMGKKARKRKRRTDLPDDDSSSSDDDSVSSSRDKVEEEVKPTKRVKVEKTSALASRSESSSDSDSSSDMSDSEDD